MLRCAAAVPQSSSTLRKLYLEKSPWPCKPLSPFFVAIAYRVVLPTAEHRAGQPAARSHEFPRAQAALGAARPAPFAERGGAPPGGRRCPAPQLRSSQRCRSAPRKPRRAVRFQVGFAPISSRRAVFWCRWTSPVLRCSVLQPARASGIPLDSPLLFLQHHSCCY